MPGAPCSERRSTDAMHDILVHQDDAARPGPHTHPRVRGRIQKQCLRVLVQGPAGGQVRYHRHQPWFACILHHRSGMAGSFVASDP